MGGGAVSEDRREPERFQPPQGMVPIPDPTVLTTEQTNRLREEMRREFISLDTLFDTKISSLNVTINKLENRVNEHYVLLTRDLDRAETGRKETLDKAANDLQLSLAATKNEVSSALRDAESRITEKLGSTAQHLLDLNDEKFSSIAKQFSERDVRTEQAAIATKIAVDAALQAQKEAANAQNESNAAAVAKSEAATTKQIDGISALLLSNVKALEDKISDVRSRLDRGEGAGSGAQGQRTEHRQDTGTMMGYVMMVIGALALLATVIVPHLGH